MDMVNEYDGEIAIKMRYISTMSNVPYALKAIVRLGVPDIFIRAGPDAKLTAAEIVAQVSGPAGKIRDPEKLERLLRLLATHDIVTEEVVEPGPEEGNSAVVVRKFGSSTVLRFLGSGTDLPSIAPYIFLVTHEIAPKLYDLHHTAVLDKNAIPFVEAFGCEVFDFLALNPQVSGVFNDGLGCMSSLYGQALVRAYKGFSGLRTLVDVGGGVGTTLITILGAYPRLKGINYDLPHVIAQGIPGERLEHVAGDFFESVPEADAIFMKYTLHDWTDEQCVTILRNCHKALPEGGKLIASEVLLPEKVDASMETQVGVLADIMMMAWSSGGKERTLRQFKQIAGLAGFSRVEVAAKVFGDAILEFHKR